MCFTSTSIYAIIRLHINYIILVMSRHSKLWVYTKYNLSHSWKKVLTSVPRLRLEIFLWQWFSMKCIFFRRRWFPVHHRDSFVHSTSILIYVEHTNNTRNTVGAIQFNINWKIPFQKNRRLLWIIIKIFQCIFL